MSAADRLLDALDPEQREVATSLTGPLCVVAGAGTGKTRAITHRIAYGVATQTYVPHQVLAVTFTARAAGEMRSRLAALGADGAQARTFHSAALRQARYFWPKVYGGELPELAVSKLPFLGEAARSCGLPTSQGLLRDVAGEIEWAKVSNVRPDDYVRLAGAAGRVVAGTDPATLAQVFAAYEQVKRDRGRLDMEDLLLVAVALLDEDDRVAELVRKQYRWFVVDEYQDVSPVQVALLQRWLGNRDDICVVGDPWQTIYTFAGASTAHLAGFGKRFVGARRLELVRNYRSTPQVVTLANTISGATGAASQGVVLRAEQLPGPEVLLRGHDDEVAEADWVAAELQRRHRAGVPLSEMAVLVRINAQTRAYEDAFSSAGLAYTMRGADRFFERPEVRQAITLLRGQARAGADEPADQGLVDQTLAVLGSMNQTREPPAGAGSQRDRWESLHALVTVAEEMATTGAPDLAQLVAELDRRAHVQDAPVAGGVTISTLHSAKGLEWTVVALAGMHEGAMPIVHADTPAAVEEERRLFYVGVTRARRDLLVTWAASRTPGGRGSRGPTRFLDGVIDPPGRAVSGAGRRARSGGRSRTASVRRCRVCDQPLTSARASIGRCDSCPPTYDESLFERLRAWRRDQAAEQKVPAYCVLTDATLVALAEELPSDTAGLARIPGVGSVKLARYGGELLDLLGDRADNAAPH
ncbi:MAG: ATP-dependent DNA helicase UvrD2 [Nocardioidaceae bacterium]|nr:ATP-dependent DNA helicase UvrD2 [Nocardioidaceae bacterium]